MTNTLRNELLQKVYSSFPPEIIHVILMDIIQSIEANPGRYLHLYPGFCGIYDDNIFQDLVRRQMQPYINKCMFAQYITLRLWPISLVSYVELSNLLKIPNHRLYIKTSIALIKETRKIKKIEMFTNHGIRYINIQLYPI